MNYFNLFSKKQQKANASFLAEQRAEQTIRKIRQLNLPETLKKQLIKRQVFDFWFSKSHLSTWAKNINYQAGEEVEYAATGIDEQNRDVLITCTNQNLILLAKQIFHPDQIKKISLNEIKSVSLKKNQVFYTDLTLVKGDKILKINSINKTVGPILAAAIKKQANLKQSDNKSDKQNLKEDQIKKLKDLMDAGILTKEEFLIKKEKVMKG